MRLGMDMLDGPLLPKRGEAPTAMLCKPRETITGAPRHWRALSCFGDDYVQQTISRRILYPHEVDYSRAKGHIRQSADGLYRGGFPREQIHEEVLQPPQPDLRHDCSLCGGRDYVECLREYRVDASLRGPFAPHNPMLRAVSPQHGRYSRREMLSGVYGDPWREAISASGALNRPRRRLGGRTASIASSFSDGSTRRYISVVRMSLCPSQRATFRISRVA